MAQILGYLSPEAHTAFVAYALAYGLDVTALANLLIARELRAPRLGALTLEPAPAPPLKVRCKVVAHAPEVTKAAFSTHSAKFGLKPSTAAAILFRTELEERWLAHHVLVKTFDST